MKRTRTAAMKMNTIRQTQTGEPASQWRSLGGEALQPERVRDTEARAGDVSVVGGSGTGKDDVVNAGELPGEEAARCPAEVRAAIVAKKSGNADGAKGGREANASCERIGEVKPPTVPERDKQGGEAPGGGCKPDYGAERRVWSAKMLEALENGVKGNKWFSLTDKVGRLDVLELAWSKVSSNAGACGVDGVTVEHFGKDSQRRLLAVKEHINGGSYQPSPVKRVWIPKAGSAEKRPLGIPTVRDRVAQTALKMVIEPIFEREFAPQSYGFRPGRSCKDALRRVDELLKSGHRYVVDVDIKGYFDAIPRKRLMERVKERIADGRVLKLIEAFLEQGVMEGMELWETESGTPQGGVISPLLANIYLNPLDWLMKEAGLEMVRYADDMVVMCKEPETATQALKKISQWMEEAGLELHPQKTQIVAMTEQGRHFDFLGYRFWKGRSGRISKVIRPKSERSIRERLKPFLKRANGHCLIAIIAWINPILRGWYGYFRHASRTSLGGMDGWVRGRLRGILRKRRGGKGKGRGNDHHRWRNRYFTNLGLFSLEHAQMFELTSLRNGDTC